MNTHTPQSLLARLDAIGQALERSGQALALIGLGSVGIEQERLDAYSDLDFFAIVADGCKARYLADLGWLSAASPLAYTFRNTPDGFKALFADGIFCEFAVFELPELRHIPFAPGRVVWKQPWIDANVAAPAAASSPHAPRSPEWAVGEALTNLYVGLGRFRRGEKLSAMRFIQGYAIDRILELAAQVETPGAAPADVFTPERRAEQRFAGLARELPGFAQGYERSPHSALAILAYLERHFEVNAAMAVAVRALAG
jgi:lincosamide nucleotidyltransferase B/F